MEGKSSTKHASSVDLDFEVQVKPFRPGTGYITLGADDTYYYNFICITKLTVTGQIAIDGESKQVTGSAYYNHQWFNISPISAFHRLWGRQNVGSYNVMIYDMVAAERLGLDQIPLFTIDDQQGNRVFESTSAEGMDITVLDSYVQEQTGKRYPKTVRYTFDRGRRWSTDRAGHRAREERRTLEDHPQELQGFRHRTRATRLARILSMLRLGRPAYQHDQLHLRERSFMAATPSRSVETFTR